MQRRYRGSRSHWQQRTALAAAVAACFAGNVAFANPTGPAVAQGQATFATQGNTLTVTNTPGTVINWQGFSIAGNEIARFIQQSQSSSVLNRVVGINPSAILGTLQSNGRVFLVNPNGITIGPGANIDVAGFLASTLNLSDADFLAGRMRFSQTPGAGSVVNHGSISTSTGGMVYLVGHDVQNSGIIRSPQGEILLAAGKSVELVDAQTPEVRVQLTAPDNQALNLGQLIAAGGRIGMYGTLIRHSGVASANTAAMGENGKIVFRAVKDVTLDAGSTVMASGPQGGSVTIQAETGSALVAATVVATGSAGVGGSVQVLGHQVGLFDGAGIDVSGRSGGGTVLVGGDFQGNNAAVQNASRTFFGAGATIAADAVETGNGGKVILWSDDVTRAFGSVTARGGAQSGNGGFVEISGKQSLAYSGTVNTLAPFGTAGLLLLDPADLDIVATGNLDVSGASPFAPLGGDGAVSTLGWNTITGAGGLGGGNVIITTVGTPAVGSETGRIRIQTAGAYTSTNSLTINAAGAIEVNAAVTNSGSGTLTLNAQGGTLNVAQTLTTTGGALNLTGSAGISLGANLSSGGGAIAFNNALTLTAANLLVNAGVGNIGFSSTVNGGTNSLTTSNTGTLSFGGTISNMTNLTIQGGPSSVALPQTTLSGNLSLTSAGNITQTGVLAVTGTSGITSTGGNVTLDNSNNNFGGLVTASGADISLRDTSALDAAITATGAGVLQAGDNLTVSGSTGTTLQTTTTGTGTTDFGVTTVGSNLTTLSAAGVGQTGKLTVTGTSGITATSGDIALAGFNNSFGGTVTASASGAGVVALRTDATPLVLGNVATGSAGLGLYLSGNVSQAGGTAITAGGPVYVEANAAGINVALANATNDFNGGAITLAIAGPGTYTNVSVRDTDALASISVLPANIGGNLTLQFDNAGMTLPGLTVGGNVQIIAGGAINVSGNVSSSGTAALTTTAGNIALGADFGSSGAATTLTSAGNITQTAGTVSGTDVTLNAATGVGGGTGARVATAADNLAARSTTSGGVFVSEADAVTLNTLSSVANGAAGGDAYDLTAGGTITVTTAVNSGAATGTTTLAATAGGNIVLGANVGNTSAATTLGAAGNITQTIGVVSGSDVILDSVTGVGGGTGARVATAAANLAARSTISGGVFVSEADAVTLTTLSGVANAAAGGSVYDLTAGGTINVANTVNVAAATGSTTLTTSAGNIALGANVGNASSITTLASAGDITQTAGTVIAGSLLLDAATAIGTGAARISVNTGTLAARTGAGATGGIFVTESNDLVINTVGAVAGVSAGNGGEADIRTTAGDITLSGNVGATGAGNVTLIAGGGAGNDLIAGAGRVSTGSGLVTLQGAAVGTTAAPILTSIGTGTLAATSGAGDIAVSNNTAGGLNSNQLTGFTTGGGVQTISVLQTAGNFSLDSSLNVGTDALALGASGGNIIGNAATTLTAGALTLDAGGLIGGANAVNTSTTGTLTLNSGGTAAAGNITVSEASALPVSRVSLGGSGAGTGRTVSLTSVAGPITVNAAIGNVADHLILVAAAGNITGGAGTATATDLTLNAAGGIGAGSAVKSNTSGNLSLTTAGNAAAGDIALVETNALNTSRVTTLNTTGAGTQAVSITAPSITLGAGIGSAADNLTLIASTGTINGGALVTANDLRLDGFNGIGTAGTPIAINTAGNLAARLTNGAASGAIVITEVAAGAGLTVGTANGISGVASANNRAVTLSADSGNIVLNQLVNSDSGQVQLNTTGSGNVLIDASVSGGLVNISAAGTIADTAQITGTTLTTGSVGGTVLDFGHAVAGFNATNITGGHIQLVNTAPTLTVTGVSQNGGGNVIINNTGALTINGAINNAGTGGALNLTGSTGINLNQNLTATDGNITLNNATTLGASVQIAAGTGTVTLTGATGIGANNLTVSSSGVTTITGGITGTTGNLDITAATRTDVDGAIALSGAGTVQLDRAVLSGVNVTTAGGNITFDGAATTDIGPLQVGSGGGDVLFNNTLALGTGAGLTVLAGTGTAIFTGTVEGPAGLAVTASGNTVFSSAVGVGTALASLGTNGGGLTQLNGGAVTTTGGQTYSDAVTLGADTTLVGAGMTFSSTLNSAGAARTLQINDSSTTTFSSTVGNTLALASLTTNTGGATAINGGSVATTGGQTYNDAVTLGLNTTLNGVDITFNSTLNSSGAARTLQINDSGTTTFGGIVGNTLALASLTTDTGGVTAINTTAVNTTGTQTYNDAVTLGALATLTSSGGSNIRFVDTLDGSSGLIVNTAGNTIFSAVVGGTAPLASLTTDAAGTTQVNGGAVTTVGAQTYNDSVTIAGPTTFNATAVTATLDFNATLAAATHALTLTADEINLAGGAGSVTGTGLVTLQPNNTAAAFNIGSAAGATVGALDLAVADLAALANGFSAINLGQVAGTHAITIGNATFQDTLLVRSPVGGSININGALSATENITLNAGGAVQGGGSIAAPRVTILAGGIGSLGAPLQLDTPDLDVQNSAGNAVMANAGPVNLLNNFRNTASGGELRLIANNGAINTGTVAVQSAGGRIALIASDTTGGATGNVIIGTGGIASAGGDIALHAADNITINGAIVAGAGNVRMLAGTGPGINAAHASFTGGNPPAPTELAPDEFGFIVFNAPVSAANMVLVSSTSAMPTIINAITQTAAGSIATTGALTAVTLRGAGAPGNGGGTVDLNDATGNNSTGLINLFACSFDGCPNPLPTAPFVNQGAPVLPFTTAVYSDGQLFYSDVGGTNVTGIGTSGDFTLYTPGSVTITGPSLSAKNLTIEALVDINVDLLAPFTNNDINGGQPGGSLNFIAGQNVNYTAMVAGATIGTAATPFNHDLKFQAAGNVTIANGIYVGAGNFAVQANRPVSLDGNTINIPATGTGSVLMQGNHVVSSMGDLAVSGVNLTVQGGDTGSPNQSVGGQQLLSAGTIALNLTGDVNVTGGTATTNSGSGALIRAAVVNVGSAGTPVANLNLTGGTSVVSGTTNHVADARITGTTALNVRVAGNVGITGGSATITSTAGASQTAGASAILEGNNFNLDVAGNVTLAGGTASAATGGNTATANARIVAHSAFSPVIQGDLNLTGGNATAQPIAGEIANAVASARFESDGNLLLKVAGNVDLLGGNAIAINNSGGIFAEADAGAFVRSSAKVGINVDQNFDITGGNATATGSGLRAIASAGVNTGDIATGESLLITTTGNMRLTGGTGAGAAADAAALIYSAAEAKLNIGGAGGLRLEGGTGPFFPPFGSGVFTPNSDLFHMIGGNSLMRIQGSAYPITVTGLITMVSNPALGAALFISEAPPLNLDSLLAAFIKTTDCVSFSGGSCTLSGAVASGSGKGSKDPAGGVCK